MRPFPGHHPAWVTSPNSSRQESELETSELGRLFEQLRTVYHVVDGGPSVHFVRWPICRASGGMCARRLGGRTWRPPKSLATDMKESDCSVALRADQILSIMEMVGRCLLWMHTNEQGEARVQRRLHSS